MYNELSHFAYKKVVENVDKYDGFVFDFSLRYFAKLDQLYT